MPVCAHCGGTVGAHGYADGGRIRDGEWSEEDEDGGTELEEGIEEDEMTGGHPLDGLEAGQQLEELEPVEGLETEQHARTEALRDGAFVDTISRRRGFSSGGPVPPPAESKPVMTITMHGMKNPEASTDEMKKKKYGFKKGA